MAQRAHLPVPVKNADRLVYPAAGFTKGQVVEYYVRIAPWILPHLKDRPVTLKRYPDQAHGEFFYEKDGPAFTPPWVKTFPVWRRSGESQIHYILINDVRTLAWAAAVGTLEIHSFLAKAPQFEIPTQVVFDLDPGEGVDILTCGEVAFLLRDLLQRLGLTSLVKVSGSKGLQIYVPLNTPTTYAATQPFARTVAEMLAKQHPRLIVAEMERAQRKRRVFIDWSQNADYKTTVGVYSLRAKRRHPYVSMPVTWEELHGARKAREPERLYFQADAAIARAKKLGDLFAPVLTLKQQLPEAFRVPATATTRDASIATTPVKENKTSKTPRASAQGGRRRFAVVDRNGRRELLIELHHLVRAWTIAHRLTAKPGGTTRAVAVDIEPDEAERIFNASEAAWDSGTVELIEGNYAKGYLDLFFSGSGLKGEWVMVQERGASEWKLIRPVEGKSYAPESFLAHGGRSTSNATGKSVSPPRAAAGAARVAPGLPGDLGPLPHGEPRFLTPMECRLVDSVPEGEGWVYELKLDGYRIIAVKRQGAARLFSRYGNPFTDRFPVIGRALRDSALDDCVLDGEIVALDDQGRPSFQELQNVQTTGRPIVYYVFDLLHYGGRDLLHLPLRDRKRALEAVAPAFQNPVRLAAVVEHDPKMLLEEVRRRGLEGVVAKRAESAYESGKRSGAWVKYRVAERDEFVIGGYLPGRNYLDALLIGKLEGDHLMFVKKLRNGFVPQTRREVYEALQPLRIAKCPFVNLPERAERRGAVDAQEMKKCVWVEPKIGCEVEFTEWTADGRLRHAAFRRLAEPDHRAGVAGRYRRAPRNSHAGRRG